MDVCEKYLTAKAAVNAQKQQPHQFDVNDLVDYAMTGVAPVQQTWNGDKFEGGFGITSVLDIDYFTLRLRSSQLFRTNTVARGMVRRFVTNKIGTGLNVLCDIEPDLVSMNDDEISDWAQKIESWFIVYGDRKEICDYQKENTLAELQEVIDREAMIDGDILVICRINEVTGLPNIQLIRGEYVNNPVEVPESIKVEYGVHLDKKTGSHLGYYVENPETGNHHYVPAYGEKSGRRIAWLHYGSELRHGEVRGEPLLGLLIQSLKELDRYRDATLRKAVVNSIFAMFVVRDVDSKTPASKALTKTRNPTPEGPAPTDTANLNLTKYNAPGVIIDGLAPGEEPKFHNPQGLGEAYSTFEKAMINTMAWVLETPPEIMTLQFNSNYSASQAATNEYKLLLDKLRKRFANQTLQPIYEEFVYSMLLLGRLTNAELYDAWSNPNKWLTKGAWLSTEWAGYVKPSVDPVKTVTALILAKDQGWITNNKCCRILNGSKYSKNIARIAKEMEQAKAAGVPQVVNKTIIDAVIEDAAKDTEEKGDEGKPNE